MGKGQVHPLPKKAKNLKQVSCPSTKKQLQWFLGLVEYYRCLIHDFATIASSLTEHLQGWNPNNLRWDEEGLAAFQCLHNCLSSGPVLQNHDFSPPPHPRFFLQVDTSDMGIRVVLSQKYDGQDIYKLEVTTR